MSQRLLRQRDSLGQDEPTRTPFARQEPQPETHSQTLDQPSTDKETTMNTKHLIAAAATQDGRGVSAGDERQNTESTGVDGLFAA